MISRTNEQAKADQTRRRAEALRANLKRRKAAARGTGRAADPDRDPPPASAGED